ncbi:inactive heparanase-2-like, partial [Littorina saxatilis]|uniref:Glycoside hydrolase family 79 protein n=1 Tax=Littorina saxatilis TaxID=31220 RepID=A0AAN9AL72_9CAEN
MEIKFMSTLLLCLLWMSAASSPLQPDHHKARRFSGGANESVTVTINLQQSVSTIGPHFVGVTIDSRRVWERWDSLDFTSKKVQNMARALTPTYFRLGGTMADAMTYVLGSATDLPESTVALNHSKFNMTEDQWVTVNEFSRTVGWDFIMDLNALKRNADGSWNPDNARQLLQFSADRNYTIAGFELGNEYESYQSVFNTTLSPGQLSKDMVTLQSLLAEFPQYYSAFIVGPESGDGDPAHFRG